MAKKKKGRLLKELRTQMRENKKAFILWLVLRLFVIAAMVLSAVRGYYENMFLCLAVLILFLVPAFIEKKLDIRLPSGLQILILIHIFATEILGELACYYVTYQHWDTIMHTVWGFLCAAIGYSMVDIMNRGNNAHRFRLSPAYMALAAFCFSMTIGVLWEFFEFAMDRVFLLDMQKDTVLHKFTSVMLDETQSNIPILVDNITSVSINGTDLGLGGYLDIGLYDTMEDLFVNFIGALVFSTIGFLSNKSEKARKLAFQFIPRAADESTDSQEADDENAPTDDHCKSSEDEAGKPEQYTEKESPGDSEKPEDK